MLTLPLIYNTFEKDAIDFKPEEEARKKIDTLLEKAGWLIQDYRDLNLGAGVGAAVREYPLNTGFADYMLFVERHAVGVVEAKPEGTTLSGVSEQTEKYLRNFPEGIPHRVLFCPLPMRAQVWKHSSGICVTLIIVQDGFLLFLMGLFIFICCTVFPLLVGIYGIYKPVLLAIN
jgi:hypothetical protein